MTFLSSGVAVESQPLPFDPFAGTDLAPCQSSDRSDRPGLAITKMLGQARFRIKTFDLSGGTS
jgi:hypothetical protein